MRKDNYDAIIIGSGFGGLIAGALLAHSGAKVLVLEQHYEVGGCVSMFRRGKYQFDVAVHLLGGCEPGGLIHSLYERLGLADQLEFLEVNPMYHLYLGEHHYEIPANLDHLADKMGNWFPQDHAAIKKVIEEIKTIGGAILRGDFQSNPQVGLRLMELSTLSFDDYLKDRFHHPHTSLVLSSLHPYAGVNVKQLSTVFMMSMLMSYHGGAYYPRGGSQKMSHLLRDYISAHHGQVLTRKKVEKILYDGTSVQGVVDQKGNEYYAPVVISNADLQTTMTELLGEEFLPDTYQADLQRLTPSHSAVILYAVVKNEGFAKPFPHEMFLFPDHELDNDQKYLYHPLDEKTDPSLLICCPSAVDPSLAPEGHSILSCLAICDQDEVERVRAEKGKEAISEHFLQLIEAKIPGFRERIVLSEFATPATVERYTGNQKGAIYGWLKSKDQPWLSEMGPVTPIPGLYAAGHWTPNVHGVYGACLSGLILAEELQKAMKAIKDQV